MLLLLVLCRVRGDWLRGPHSQLGQDPGPPGRAWPRGLECRVVMRPATKHILACPLMTKQRRSVDSVLGPVQCSRLAWMVLPRTESRAVWGSRPRGGAAGQLTAASTPQTCRMAAPGAGRGDRTAQSGEDLQQPQAPQQAALSLHQYPVLAARMCKGLALTPQPLGCGATSAFRVLWKGLACACP